VAENNSKGCGALMRVAPCAFFANAFDYAAQSGRLTHGNPTGYLAAGMFADILQRIVDRQDSLEHAITQSWPNTVKFPVWKKHEPSLSVYSSSFTRATSPRRNE
jgi:ADP-ribosylglycohydrolase